MKNKANIIIIVICAILAFGIAYVVNACSFDYENATFDYTIEESLIDQDIIGASKDGRTIIKMYEQGKLVGIISDKEKLDKELDNTYKELYESVYPNSALSYSTDIYFTEENSYFYYEDKDDDIINYIITNKLLSLKVNRIEFSNGAVVYCKELQDFEDAKDQYLLNYVDYESLVLIENNQLPEELTTYGERIIDIQVAETYTVNEGFANIEDIKTDTKSLLEFFCYGYGKDMEFYITEEYDTVEWVAQQYDITAQQLITLNTDVLKSETQLLAVGTKLNVTLYNSPITVIVKKERIAKEVVYAESTIYRANDELREGVNRTIVAEEDGSKNVYYTEVYVNGILSTQEINNEVITLDPVREVVEYGTKVIPGVGTGKFRWPVANPRVSCHWGCYNSPTLGFHRGVDIVNSKNRYGSVYAADRGTIDEVGYTSINGYYVIIDHNNGYKTYYGHMKSKCYYNEGVNVEKGDVIGQIGMTGAATGPHVHFIIIKNGVKSDACKWLGC